MLGSALPLLCATMAMGQDPVMVSTPSKLEFYVVQGATNDPTPQSVMLSLSNGDTTEYWAWNDTWRVSANPSSGWAPGTMQVRVRGYSSVPVGTYRDTILITWWDTLAPPLAIPITTMVSAFPLSTSDSIRMIPRHVQIEEPATDTSFALAVYVDLATTASALTIPLTYAGHSALSIDTSVHYPPDHLGVTLGPAGRDTAWTITTSLVDPVQKTLLLGFISFSQVEPVTDTLAWIHFKLDSSDVPAHVWVHPTKIGDNYLSVCDPMAIERTPVWSDAEIFVGYPLPPVSICIPPMGIEFRANSGGPLPTPYSIWIAECHGGTLNWSVAHQPSWLDVSPQGGSDSESVITLAPNTTNLPPGNYGDSVVIIGERADNSPKKLRILYIVAPNLPKVDSMFIEPDTLRIRGPYADTAFHMSVWLKNDHVLGAVSIPIQWTGLPALRLDSSAQSFDGYPGINWGPAGSDQVWTIRTCYVNNPARAMLVGLVSFSQYPANRSGSLVDVYFAVDSSNSGGTAWLDSSLVMSQHLMVTDVEATDFTPVWQPGVILVGDSLPLPRVCVETDSLEFEAIQSGPVPADQEVVFHNCLTGELNWTAQDNANWLEVAPASGIGSEGSVSIHVNTSELPPGVHWATVTIRDLASWQSAAFVIVRYVVQAPPVDRLYPKPGVLTLPNNRDTTFTVPIMLELVRTEAQGIVIPLTYAGSSANISLDTLVDDGFGNRGVTQGPLGSPAHWNSFAMLHDPVARTVLLGYTSFGAPLFPPAHDTLVVLHFAVDGQPGSQVFSLDTTRIPPANELAIIDALASEAPVDWSSGAISIVGPTDVEEDGLVARGFELEQNIPNPFNASTEIRLNVPSGFASAVSLSIHDVLGRRVNQLAIGPLAAGPHRIVWDGKNQGGEPAATGVYFIVLEAQSTRLVKKALLLR